MSQALNYLRENTFSEPYRWTGLPRSDRPLLVAAQRVLRLVAGEPTTRRRTCSKADVVARLSPVGLNRCARLVSTTGATEFDGRRFRAVARGDEELTLCPGHKVSSMPMTSALLARQAHHEAGHAVAAIHEKFGLHFAKLVINRSV